MVFFVGPLGLRVFRDYIEGECKRKLKPLFGA